MTSLLDLTRVTKLYGTVIGANDITLDPPPGGYGLPMVPWTGSFGPGISLSPSPGPSPSLPKRR